MKKFILQLIVLSLVVYFLLPNLVPGISVDGTQAAIIAAVLFAFINIAVKPILGFITLPFNILSLGLVGLIINVLLFWFVASIIDGFAVVDFISAFWGALVMSLGNWIVGKIIG